jgi:aspartate/methionine/tyrosine aminotransferase
MQSSAIRELLKLTERPDVTSFAGGLPAPEVFPVGEFQEACQRVLAEHGPQALQYSTTEGYRPLREMIARHTARYGIVVEPDNILLTSGSQQALNLIGKIFINPGDACSSRSPPTWVLCRLGTPIKPNTSPSPWTITVCKPMSWRPPCVLVRSLSMCCPTSITPRG